jgi:hypothetical protein
MARPKRITDILYSGIGGEGFQERLAQMRVLREWAEVVGPRVAQVTRATAIRNGVLTVAVRGAVWKAEIEYLKQEITDALNRRLGREAVAGIRLTSGYRERTRRESDRSGERETPDSGEARISSRQRRRIEHAVSIVSDPELRGALMAAWEAKKGLDELRRKAGWKQCRACGEYDAWRGGMCRACALDVVSAAGSTASGETDGRDR